MRRQYKSLQLHAECCKCTKSLTNHYTFKHEHEPLLQQDHLSIEKTPRPPLSVFCHAQMKQICCNAYLCQDRTPHTTTHWKCTYISCILVLVHTHSNYICTRPPLHRSHFLGLPIIHYHMKHRSYKTTSTDQNSNFHCMGQHARSTMKHTHARTHARTHTSTHTHTHSHEYTQHTPWRGTSFDSNLGSER